MQHTECSPQVNLLEQSFEVAGSTLGAGISRSSPNETRVVLLHGVTRQWRDYANVMPSFGNVVSLDHRGHGSSSRGQRYRVSDFVEDAVQWLSTQPDESVILMGHSLGAMTAAMVAARLPERIKALVLEDPPGTYLADRIQDSRYWLQFNGLRERLQKQHWADAASLAVALAEIPVQHPFDGSVVPWSKLRTPQALAFAADCLIKMDPSVLNDLVEGHWLEGLDWFGELDQIRCPTLLLRSDPAAGGMLIEDEARLISKQIAHSVRIDSPGHEHNLHGTAPERYLALVHEFLQPHLPTNRQP